MSGGRGFRQLLACDGRVGLRHHLLEEDRAHDQGSYMSRIPVHGLAGDLPTSIFEEIAAATVDAGSLNLQDNVPKARGWLRGNSEICLGRASVDRTGLNSWTKVVGVVGVCSFLRNRKSPASFSQLLRHESLP